MQLTRGLSVEAGFAVDGELGRLECMQSISLYLFTFPPFSISGELGKLEFQPPCLVKYIINVPRHNN